MASRISIRGYRTGFLFVVALFTAVATFTLYREVRTNGRVQLLVEQAIERDRLVAQMRVDSLLLKDAADDYINAQNDAELKSSDDEMKAILEELADDRAKVSDTLLPGEIELWRRFDSESQTVVAQVHTVVKYANRKEAERAKKHLEEAVRPITWDIDQTANELHEKNKEETRSLVRNLQDIRLRTVALGASVSVLAVLLALFVGWQVTNVLRKQESTIVEQMTELDRRNKELDAFASRVAHDLISPLAPLKGYLTLIRRSPSISDPEVKEMLTQAEASSARMSELIDALLRFCRSGTPSEPTVSELDTAVSTILLEVSQSAAANKVQLDRHLEQTVKVGVPAQLLQSIAQNVLSNAVKYSAGKPDAKVTVRVAREKAQAVLEVTDNGVGISPSSQKSLFQPFFRAPEAKGMPGHGLGMAITKRLVEAHGGTIAVKSDLGAGTQVTVRFPLVSSDRPSSAPAVLEGARKLDAA